jgi:KipI family sensor histidine kinase inhibitor
VFPAFWPLAESGLLVRLGDEIDAPLSRRIAALTDALDAERLPGVVDLVPSYTTLTILLDPAMADTGEIAEAVRRCWEDVATAETPAAGRKIEIPVVYGGEFGPDLTDVARQTGLAPEDVIRRHSEATYLVGALGFAPGFAYLIGLPPELATPRRASPRKEVPPGSVGIGGGQTGIYALPTPGGWQLIGRTFERLFDPLHIGEETDNPFPLRMGDEVRFVARDSPPNLPSPPAPLPELGEGSSSAPGDHTGIAPTGKVEGRAVVEVVEPGLQTTVQDAGRPGYGRLGIAPGGAADRAAFRRANWLVGNGEDAAVLEIALVGPRLRFTGFDGERVIAVAGADLEATLNGRPVPLERAIAIRNRDELWFGPRRAGARAYLAVQGGFDVPLVLGSRSTDVTAGFGGLEGRALRAGDVLPFGDIAKAGSSVPPARRDRVMRRSGSWVFRFVAGPQADRFSLAAFSGAEWRVSASSNRVGIRLEGPAVNAAGGTDIISEGMTTGTIQITNEGKPIVMLPARATIGGYARIGTVIGADLDRLAQLAPGDGVRFREVSVDEARTLTLAANEETGDVDAGPDGLALAIGLVERIVAAGGAIEALEVEIGSAGFRLRTARQGDRQG